MNRKLIASLMLGAVIGLSGAAQAENMIKGIAVTDEDWPRVQEKCNALAAAHMSEQQKVGTDSSSDSTSTDGTGTDGSTDNGQSENNDSQGSSDQVGSETNALLAKSIDLDAVVYQDCVDAGLVTNP